LIGNCSLKNDAGKAIIVIKQKCKNYLLFENKKRLPTFETASLIQ